MSRTKAFPKLLEDSQIPHVSAEELSSTPPSSRLSLSNALIFEIHKHYPANEVPQPKLNVFLLNYACRKWKSVEEVSRTLWEFYTASIEEKDKESEIGLFYFFLNDIWDSNILKFYLKARKLILQIKFGDRTSLNKSLSSFSLASKEWVQIASKAFSECYKPTSFVQIISARLFELDYAEIPAHAFVYYCVQVYIEAKDRHRNSGSKVPPIDSLFYNRVSGLIHNKLYNESPSSTKRATQTFNLMDYGKLMPRTPAVRTPPKAFKKKESKLPRKTEVRIKKAENKPQNNHDSIQDLLGLTEQVDTKPAIKEQINKKPGEFLKPTDDLMFLEPIEDLRQLNNNTQSQEIEKLKKEIEKITREKEQFKETLQETVEYCDTVSCQHDILLDHHNKMKGLVCNLTEKLLKLDSKALEEFDFSIIIDDPCKDFSQTGILREKHELSEGETNYHPEAVFMDTNRADKLERIPELDELIFTENINTGNGGFYTQNIFENA